MLGWLRLVGWLEGVAAERADCKVNSCYSRRLGLDQVPTRVCTANRWQLPAVEPREPQWPLSQAERGARGSSRSPDHALARTTPSPSSLAVHIHVHIFATDSTSHGAHHEGNLILLPRQGASLLLSSSSSARSRRSVRTIMAIAAHLQRCDSQCERSQTCRSNSLVSARRDPADRSKPGTTERAHEISVITLHFFDAFAAYHWQHWRTSSSERSARKYALVRTRVAECSPLLASPSLSLRTIFRRYLVYTRRDRLCLKASPATGLPVPVLEARGRHTYLPRSQINRDCRRRCPQEQRQQLEQAAAGKTMRDCPFLTHHQALG